MQCRNYIREKSVPVFIYYEKKKKNEHVYVFTHRKEEGGRNPTVLTISSAITASWRAAEVHKIGCDPSGISAGFPHLS